MPTQSRTKYEMVHIRFRGNQYALLKAAAKITGQTPKIFVVDTAHRRAVNAISDQRVFPANYVWDETLAHPPEPNRQLIDLMNSTGPWEQAKSS